MATTKNITMKQFNGTDYDTLYPKTVYSQVSGVAPSGYGLGDAGKQVTDLNDAQDSGFYSAIGAANIPTGITSAQYASVLVLCSQPDRVTQVYFQDVTDGDGAIAVRRLNGNGWSEWEYLNPPMKVGVEYRTTKRYMEKPVYAKLVNFGAMPNTAAKTLAHGISDVKYVVSLSGDGNWSNLIGYRYVDYAYADSTNIYIKSNADLSTMYAHVVMEYTKSTD